jgi:hypothetical protein
MKRILGALLLAAALAACEAEDFITWGTVVGVEEMETAEVAPEPELHDDDLRIPEVGWKLELRLDGGETVSLEHNGNRRFERGERVRLLKSDDGQLLL